MNDAVKPIPTVLDTDIGFDVDDVWALAFLLRCPELDIRLITTCTGDTAYRARVTAKLLEIAGRTDIPIGIGIPLDETPATHAGWLGDYVLEDYPGTILRDGVGALCDAISLSPEPVSLVCIGPLPNIAAALARDPDIAANARFIGMHGSLRRGYLGAPKPMREYNVKQHALACRAVFQAGWEKLITPLDTCGDVILDGERFARVMASKAPLTRAVLDNHFGWFEAMADFPLLKDMNPNQQSSILYDCVAVYLAMATDCVAIEQLPIEVTGDGKTLISDAGDMVACATEWRDREAFLDLLADRLA